MLNRVSFALALAAILFAAGLHGYENFFESAAGYLLTRWSRPA